MTRLGPKNIFIQYFSHQMLKNYGLDQKYAPRHLTDVLLRVTRVCYLLCAEKLLVPTIDLVESPYLPHVMPSLRSLVALGDLQFVGSEIEPGRFIEHKQSHFSSSRLYPMYFENTIWPQLEGTSDQWIRRTESTTDDLTRRWKDAVARLAGQADVVDKSYDLSIMGKVWRVLRTESSASAEALDNLYYLPERLGGEAFLWDVIEARNVLKGANATVKSLASLFLGMKWLQSHIEEFDAKIITDVPFLNWLDCSLRRLYPQYVLSYNVAVRILRQYCLGDLLDLPFELLQDLRQRASFLFFKRAIWLPKHDSLFLQDFEAHRSWFIYERFMLGVIENINVDRNGSGSSDWAFKHVLDVLDVIANKLLDFQHHAQDVSASAETLSYRGGHNMPEKAKVFLVHSWNSKLKNEVHLFLFTELQLPVVVMDASPMGGRTLPEKFEATAQEASFAVVLITADEQVTKEDGSPIWRIRPNVLLEIGYFWGKLGRKNLAIIIERASEIEIPTDLAGIGYLPLKEGFASIKFELLKELRQAGILS